MVGFEFERLLPFRRNEAYYAHRILARDKTSRTLQVELTALPRAEVDAVVQIAARAGLHVASIEIPAAASGDAPSSIALEKSGQASRDVAKARSDGADDDRARPRGRGDRAAFLAGRENS